MFGPLHLLAIAATIFVALLTSVQGVEFKWTASTEKLSSSPDVFLDLKQAEFASLDGTKIVATEKADGNVWRSEDSGATWTALTTGATFGKAADYRERLGPVTSSSDGVHLLVHVESCTSSQEAQMWHSDDSGTTWEKGGVGGKGSTSVPDACTTLDLEINDSGNYLLGIFVTDFTSSVTGLSPTYVECSANGGVTWVKPPTSEVPYNCQGIAMAGDNMFITTKTDGIYKTGDTVCSFVSIPNTVKDWGFITSSDDGTKLFATVGITETFLEIDGSLSVFEYTTTSTDIGIWKSVDSGTTWTQCSATKATWTSISSSSDGLHVVATASSHSGTRLLSTDGIFTSFNGGDTWIENLQAPSYAVVPNYNPERKWAFAIMAPDGGKGFGRLKSNVGSAGGRKGSTLYSGLPTCSRNENVVSNACTACSGDKVRERGDLPSGSDTACKDLCAINQRANQGACYDCSPGWESAAGANPAYGTDSFCTKIVCTMTQHVVSNVCTDCPAGKVPAQQKSDSGERFALPNSAIGSDTECFLPACAITDGSAANTADCKCNPQEHKTIACTESTGLICTANDVSENYRCSKPVAGSGTSTDTSTGTTTTTTDTSTTSTAPSPAATLKSSDLSGGVVAAVGSAVVAIAAISSVLWCL